MLDRCMFIGAMFVGTCTGMEYSVGTVEVTDKAYQLTINEISEPILIMGVPSYKDKEAGVISVQKTASNDFSVKFREWSTLDEHHDIEVVPYLAIDQGRYTLDDGTILEAGTLNLTSKNKLLVFQEEFPQVPKLFLSATSNNSAHAFNVRTSDLTRQSYKITLDYAENVSSNFTAESVNYLAIYSPSSNVTMPNGESLIVNTELLNHSGTRINDSRLFIHEERTADSEVTHVNESVSILNFEGKIFATSNTTYGGDTFSFRNENLYPGLTFLPAEETGTNKNIALNKTNGLSESHYSASTFYPGYTPASAFDGYDSATKINVDSLGKVSNGAWLGYQKNTPQWLQVAFTQVAYISGFKLFVYEGARKGGMAPQEITLQVSNDNITFEDHESFTLQNVNQSVVTLDEPAFGRYVRLVVKSNYGHNAIVIGELEYYGKFVQGQIDLSEPTPLDPNAITCASIYAETPNASDGVYYLEPSSLHKGNGFNAYCDMTNLDGGWTLVANHKDAQDSLATKNFVEPTELGVLTDDKWQSVLTSMQIGIMTVDENNKVAFISKKKLQRSLCVKISDVSSLSYPVVPYDTAYLWHDEVSGCSSTGLDYSYISLSTQYTSRADAYLTVGASLYQHATKFDIWPYINTRYSGAEQDQLRIYVK